MLDNVLVVIPCRKGSKRLPHKNIRPVGGMALSQRTIRIAKEAGLTHTFPPYLKSQIIVSSDDVGVKNVSLAENVEFIDRPAKLATDKAKSEAVIIHAIEYVDDVFPNNEFDTIALLQVTSPLLKPKTLRKALKVFYNANLASLISVNLAYQMTGGFYIIDKKIFVKQKTLYPKGMAVYIVSEEEAIDVDYLEDLRTAEAIERGWVY